MRFVIACVLSLTLTPWLFAQSSSDQNSSGSADHKMSSSTSKTTGASDEKFLRKAAEGGKAEVELGQLALQKASDEKVKQFAQKMVDDHTKANDQLQQVAQKENISLPTQIDPEAQRAKEHLSKLSGQEFDRAYMRFQLKDHQKDVAEFKREASSGKDSDVKDFAQSTLPTLEEHLKLAQQITPQEGARASK